MASEMYVDLPPGDLVGAGYPWAGISFRPPGTFGGDHDIASAALVGRDALASQASVPSPNSSHCCRIRLGYMRYCRFALDHDANPVRTVQLFYARDFDNWVSFPGTFCVGLRVCRWPTRRYRLAQVAGDCANQTWTDKYVDHH